MKKYYIYYPRNFGNEYTIYFVDNLENEKRVNNFIDKIDWAKQDMHRISYKELLQFQSSERAYARHRENFYGNTTPSSIDELIA